MADLYRKASLERISSPDQLDKAMEVTSPVSWLVLIGCAVILVVILFFWPISIQDSVSMVGKLSDDGQSAECWLDNSDYNPIDGKSEAYILLSDNPKSRVKCNVEVSNPEEEQSETSNVLTLRPVNGKRMEAENGSGMVEIVFPTDKRSVPLISFLFGSR